MSGPLAAPRPRRRAAAPHLFDAIAAHSPYLGALIEEDRARALEWLEAPEQALNAVVVALDAALFPDEATAMRALRRAKRDAALAVALGDLSGRFDIDAATAGLTRFADSAVRAALRFVLADAAREGRLKLDAGAVERDCGFVVLALGKLGGRELNYSSDIDLVIFYDPEAKAIPEGVAPGPLFVRLAKRLARLLDERTADGYALRVDLRLRPDPGATPIAMSLASAASYYESLGQNWERAAMIKARPIAGDLALGASFLNELAPFIWRKYFDYAAIADIHAMKRQIHAVRGHGEVAVAGHDVKLGRGGIREIEFFVQTQQLVFGGRLPSLRGARTVEMLRELGRQGLVDAAAVEALSSAYAYLRAVEHRLQMIADEQTQRLPVEDVDLQAFARFCGYAGRAGFARDLTRHLRAVEKHYALLFENAPKLANEAGSLVFTGVADDPDTLATLTRLGFRQPEQATETIRGWHFGRRPAVQSARAREVLTELTPGLLAAFAGSGDPDAALAAFDAMLTRMPAAVELMSILRENASLRELFGDLLGGAPRLAEVVAARPHALDAMIDPARAALADALDEGRETARAQAYLAPSRDYEDALNRARDFAAEEKFLIGVRLLSGALDADMAARAYSALAQALAAALLARVQSEFATEHGTLPGGRVVALAMGKLGSREMTAASDLDLILIYDFAGDVSDGARPLSAALYYSRLTQRLVAALTAPTKAGRLYDVDLRLRPSGRKGPLATSLAAFAAYQREEAETWEHMALTRARCVAGDASLAAEIAGIAREVLSRARPRRALARDILAMRALIAREKADRGAFDLKLAPGGLIDIEFLAQFLILAHAADHPALLSVDTRAAMAAAARAGLLSATDGEILIEAHRLLTTVTQVLRLTLPDDCAPDQAAAGVKRRIAAAAGAPDFERLVVDLAAARARVRPIFTKTLTG